MFTSKVFLASDRIQFLVSDYNPTFYSNTTADHTDVSYNQANSTNTQAENTEDTLIGPVENQPTQNTQYDQYSGYPTNDLDTLTPTSDDSSGLLLTIIGVIAFASLVFLCLLGYILYQKKYQALVEEYATGDREQPLYKQPQYTRELTEQEKEDLDKWELNPKEYRVPDVNVKEREITRGKYFEVIFPEKEIRTIVSNMKIEQNKSSCYFEIEIEELGNDVDIVIGAGIRENFNKVILPGDRHGSIGFHSKGGNLKINGLEMGVYQAFEAPVGATLGLGYNFGLKRIYLFHNKKYLNESSRESDPPKIKHDATPLKMLDADYYLMIGATGFCKIKLNIGGLPFSIYHEEIANSLL